MTPRQVHAVADNKATPRATAAEMRPRCALWRRNSEHQGVEHRSRPDALADSPARCRLDRAPTTCVCRGEWALCDLRQPAPTHLPCLDDPLVVLKLVAADGVCVFDFDLRRRRRHQCVQAWLWPHGIMCACAPASVAAGQCPGSSAQSSPRHPSPSARNVRRLIPRGSRVTFFS
jgi:hypothetical protein